MPTIQDVEQARNIASTKAGTAGQLAAGEYSVESVLKQKLNDAFKQNQDIVKPLDTATSDYFAAPSVAREKFSDIFNPFQREKLVSQYTNTQAVPMLNLQSLLGSRQGSIADIINAGVGGYKAQSAVAANEAANARQLYNDIFGEYKFGQEQALRREEINNKPQKGPFESFIEQMAKLKAFDPNQASSTAGAKADSVLTGMNNIRKASDEDLRVAGQIAAGTGTGGIPGAMGILAKAKATPQQIQLAQDLVNTRTVLRQEFSGAAFSPTELGDYNYLVGTDPLSLVKSGGIKASMDRLEPFFKNASKKGKNPYQDMIDQLNQMFIGQLNPEDLEITQVE